MDFNNKDKLYFLVFIAIRLFSVCFVQTSFVPDEYWQSLEVAHRLTYGYGYMTWEWEKQIRSSVYPLIFSIINFVSSDSSKLLIYLPRLCQAILSAVGDYYTYKLASKLFGYSCSQWTVFNICSSWFLFYCSSRTLTNMTETSLSACGLYLYPWKKEKNKGLNCKYLWFVGGSVLIRPTCIVQWVPLILIHVWREKYFFQFAQKALAIGVIIFGVQLLSDRWFYGQWTITLYNFFFFNWKKDIGIFYGSHHFLWYITIGLPVVLTTLYIPFVMGLKLLKLLPFNAFVAWFIFIFSIPSHKEFRFLLPILPVCLIITSVVMAEISNGKMVIFCRNIPKKLSSYLACVTVVLNFILSFYMCIFHQRGPLDVVQRLSDIVSDHSQVLFLMPCHSTPYFSHIHKNITMKFLTCEPNFENSVGYKEEADEFFSNPLKWLSMNFKGKSNLKLPTHIVMFDSLHSKVSTFLELHKYFNCYTVFYSHFFDERRGKYIQIYCKA